MKRIVRIRIRNNGKIVRMKRMHYTLEQHSLRVDFSFKDVDGHVVLRRVGQGVELQGTFKSRRDQGKYVGRGEATQRGREEGSSKRARSRSSDKARSGRLSIES